MNKYQATDNASKKKDMVYVNERIHANSIHIVDDGSGNDIGTVSRFVALNKAKAANLDLVQISFQHGTSICKLCDYGKYQYEQKQKQKLAKKRAKAVIQELKEVCFSIRIDDGDKNTKVRHVKKFLEDNCKVKLTVQFSRREMNMLDFGKELLKGILTSMNGLFEIDSMPKTENRTLYCIIKPMKK